MNSLPIATPNLRRSTDRAPVNVFIVSPSGAVRQELQGKLVLPRWNVIPAQSGAGALELLTEHRGVNSLLLLDHQLPDIESGEFDRFVRSRFPDTQVLTLSTHGGQVLVGNSSPTPISASLIEELAVSDLRFAAGSGSVAPNSAPRFTDRQPGLRSMIGRSEPMCRVYDLVRKVAARDTTVLILGESGTGKDLAAQEIHLISPRRKQPFVVVNCAAIPETLLEAELFGYVKGSFTGAVQSRIGRIHAAHGGTLFLDEIGDMPLSLQSKILRFLEQGEVQRLGGNDNLKVDVRVVAATNVDLKTKVENREFREDLYYRLNVFPIHLPPLRERMGDLEELALAFAAKFQAGIRISSEAMQRFHQHRWPGNVRELRNSLERATIMAEDSGEIRPEHIF